MPTVARFNVTPIKGTALQHPDRVSLGPGGIPGNRRFFLVDERGALFSGFDHGPLVRLRTAVDDEAGTLVVTFPDRTRASARIGEPGDAITVDISGRIVPARLLDGTLGSALSGFVSRPVRVAMADRDGEGSDVHHLSLVSDASVGELARLGEREGDLDARRFRMDVEITGCKPFEEDTWDGRTVRLGAAVVRLHGQIPRCRVTNQDPATGLHDWGTLKHLAKHRPRIREDGGLPFGMYAEIETPGSVAVGDEVLPLN